MYKKVCLGFVSVLISIFICCDCVLSKTFTILHTNDVHGRIDACDFAVNSEKTLKNVGGVARRATLIKKIKQDNPDVLLLDAGDIASGNLTYFFFKGIPDVKFLDYMGYDAVTFGNHEFDSGLEDLSAMVNSVRMPFVSTNLDINFLVKYEKYIIKDFNGFKVAIIGLTTDDLKNLIKENTARNIKVSDPIKTTEKLVRQLNDKVDAIVVLSHMGFYDDKKLARAVPEIDIIVGGHSHTLLSKPVIIKNKRNGNKTLILQDGKFGVYLGKLDVDIENKQVNSYKYKQILVDEKILPDAELKNQVDCLIKHMNSETRVYLGKTSIPINALDICNRIGLTTAGALLTCVMKNLVPDADIAMINGGAMRANRIIEGDIYKKAILELVPFSDEIVVIEVKGKDLKSVLETSVRRLPDTNNGFLHTLGLKYTISLCNPAGKRVSDILVNGKPLNMEKSYKVVVNHFIASGGDGYFQFKKIKNRQIIAKSLQNEVIDYIKAKKNININIQDEIKVTK